MCDKDKAKEKEAEILLSEMRGVFGEQLEKFREILQEGKSDVFSVVKILFNDSRVIGFRIEKMIK